MKYVPNALTIGRIVVTPVMLVLLFSETLLGMAGALVLFILAAISDYLDGKIARDYKVRSRFGQFLDPLADKVLVLGTFVVLAIQVPHLVPWWGVALVAMRDVAVTGLRSWIESAGRSLRTLPIAKAKTAVQIMFLISMLALLTGVRIQGSVGEAATRTLESWIPLAAFVGVVLFTVTTGVLYFMRQEYAPSHLNNSAQ
jgi:CDP-diacylglycerol--glycerol-3-phosphate 3-phosphatidyltransferase